MFGPESTHTI